MTLNFVYILFATIALVSLVAAIWDLKTGEIPNRLIAVALIVALPLHTAAQLELAASTAPIFDTVLRSLGSAALGLLLAGLAPFVLWRLGLMGGGDVKLLAALGALGGPMIGVEIEFYAFALASLFGLARLAYQGQLLRTLGSSALLVISPLVPKARRQPLTPGMVLSFRFGPAVLAASMLVLGLRLVK